MERKSVSTQTRNNWLLDAGLFTSAVAVAASSLYFLYFPSAGYQGGRNPAYNMVVLFNRSTWDDLHTWTGIAMIVIALVHLVVHWNWVTMMARRVWHAWTGKSEPMNARGRFNVLVNALVAVSFVLAALSGVYFLFAGGSHGGANPDPLFLFTRATWDLIHTWSGVVMILGALAHFAIHWRWVVKVTGKIVTGLLPDLAGWKARTVQQISGE
jgi:hypothetical protein